MVASLKVPLRSLAVAVVCCACGLSSHAQTTLNQTLQAASRGEAEAQYRVAVMCLTGDGLPTDTAKAFKYLQLAADQQYAPARRALGCAYRDGDGVAQDVDKAIGYFEPLAEQGDTVSMVELAEIYDNVFLGHFSGTKRNEWYRRAAEAGSIAGKIGYATQQLYNYQASEKAAGFKQLKALAKEGHTDAMIEVGRAYYNGLSVETNRATALEWYRKAAKAGNTRAMTLVAACYRDGKGVAMDAAAMCAWYRRAAEGGDADGIYAYAKCLENGNGCEANLSEAWKWYLRGAESGEKRCVTQVGRWLLLGIDGHKDLAQAIGYLRQGVDAQNGEACTLLGICYRDGAGVKQDMKQARHYWRLAYKYQNRSGAELLARSLESYAGELGHKARSEEEYEAIDKARREATDIWHDIVRWHDESHPLPLKYNPETGGYETDEHLTY